MSAEQWPDWVCDTPGCNEPARRMVGESNERLACIPHANDETPPTFSSHTGQHTSTSPQHTAAT